MTRVLVLGGADIELRIDLRQGDSTEYGPVRREHVAETLVRNECERTSATGGTVTDEAHHHQPPTNDQPRHN